MTVPVLSRVRLPPLSGPLPPCQRSVGAVNDGPFEVSVYTLRWYGPQQLYVRARSALPSPSKSPACGVTRSQFQVLAAEVHCVAGPFTPDPSVLAVNVVTMVVPLNVWFGAATAAMSALPSPVKSPATNVLSLQYQAFGPESHCRFAPVNVLSVCDQCTQSFVCALPQS